MPEAKKNTNEATGRLAAKQKQVSGLVKAVDDVLRPLGETSKRDELLKEKSPGVEVTA